MATNALRIGDLARQMKIPVETIRYYERERLLPAPRRTEGNYRLYDAALIDRLAFIRNCRNLDMTLEEIRTLLEKIDEPEQSCEAISEVLDAHIEHVRERIAELRRLRTDLQELRERCTSTHAAEDCDIVSNLTKGKAKAQSSSNHLSAHSSKRRR